MSINNLVLTLPLFDNLFVFDEYIEYIKYHTTVEIFVYVLYYEPGFYQ